MAPPRSLLAVLACSTALAALCLRADAESRKNVVLISIDTLRPDHLGCYGAKGNPTPNIDRLAARGVRFERAYSAVPITTPSHATLFTGTFPPFHGVRSNGSFALSEDRTTIAEILRKTGYATGGFVGAFPLDRQFGFAQGFDTYDDQIGSGETSMSRYDAERRASTVVDHALDWYGKRDPGKPFFLFVHCYDPHFPYSPPDPWKARFPEDPYTGEIAYVDEQIGRILTRFEHDGLIGDTLVVLVSDHGESLGEHGEATHMVFVYDATLRVAMILAGPGVPAGRVSTEPARLVDVLPTIAGSVGTALPPEVQGVDLAPAWTPGGKLDRRRYFYAESMLPQVQFGWAPLQSIRMGKWKYILAPRQELYDLETDPLEKRNLFRTGPNGKPQFESEEQGTACRAARQLLEEAAGKLSSPLAGKASREVDSEAARKLQSLGYLGSTTAHRSTASDAMTLPDPKDRIGLFNEVEKADQFGDTGQTSRAIAAYKRLITKYPGESWIRMSLARDLLTAKQYDEVLSALPRSTVATLKSDLRNSAMGMRAGAFEELGRLQDALAEWEALVKLAGTEVTVAEKGRGNVLVGLRRYSEAIPPLERFSAASGSDSEAHLLLGLAYLGAGRDEEGMAQLSRAGDLAAVGSGGAPRPRSAPLLRAARFFLKAGDRARAASLLEAVVASGGDAAPVQYELSVCYLNLGRAQDARKALDRALELDRDFYPALSRLGILLARAGRLPESIRLLERAVAVNPGSREAHLNLAVALRKAGRVAEAEKESGVGQGLAAERRSDDAPVR